MHFCQLGGEQPLPAATQAAPAPRSPPRFPLPVLGASFARPRLAALPRSGGTTAPATRRSATRLGGDPPGGSGNSARGSPPGNPPARPTLRAPAPAPRPCAQPSRALHPPHRNRFPSLIPILTLSFQICLPPPPPPPGAKPPRLPGRAGGHAGLGGRCLPALRGSPEVLGSRSSPAAAALSVSGRGAGRAPSKPLLPNLRRCAGGGRRSRGSAAALNPFFLRRRPGAPLVAQAPPRYSARCPPAGFATASQPPNPPSPPLPRCAFSPGVALPSTPRTPPHRRSRAGRCPGQPLRCGGAGYFPLRAFLRPAPEPLTRDLRVPNYISGHFFSFPSLPLPRPPALISDLP